MKSELENQGILSRPKLSVVVCMYNMRREAERTLYSLGDFYQSSMATADYEVIVIDNGSDSPLDKEFVYSFGEQFRYFYFDTSSSSPAQALNFGVRQSEGELLLLCIDGARILSPQILSLSLNAACLTKHPFIYTLGMHLGDKPQNFLLESGYNQEVEDSLLRQVEWKKDGYELFTISCPALSCKNGYFSSFSESNAFCLFKEDFLRIGGFDERFDSKGGGLVNLDIFNKAHCDDLLEPILLLGEATFHQFHGGVATNVLIDDHPWESMCQEYRSIKGKNYQCSYYSPTYVGRISRQASGLVFADT